MVNESGKSARNDGFDKSPEEFYDKNRKPLRNTQYSHCSALLQLLFFSLLDQKLISGVFIIAGAAIGLIVVRKASMLKQQN